MTSRQTGRRLRKITGQGNKGRLRRTAGQSEKRKASGETRRFVQLIACGGIFVFLVAAKLLLPARMAEFNERLSVLMAQNMDVQAVFSAVGRAFSGEDPAEAAEEVYEAVFHPQAQPAVKNRTLRLHDGGALATLQLHRGTEDLPEAAEPEDNAAPEDTPEPVPEDEDGTKSDPEPAEDPANMAYVLYSEENLPEGVSMEQAILDFDYTTPVMGVLTSDFGYREHPIEGEERFHYGIDLAANSGTEIGNGGRREQQLREILHRRARGRLFDPVRPLQPDCGHVGHAGQQGAEDCGGGRNRHGNGSPSAF